MRSPTLLLIRMNAAETSASSAIADWTPLAVVSRSLITAEIDTFISDVSTTSTNIAMASRIANRGLPDACSGRVAARVRRHEAPRIVSDAPPLGSRHVRIVDHGSHGARSTVLEFAAGRGC